MRSLRSLWDGDDAGDRTCAIGSIKSMIGHLLTGAGAAGLIKTLMAMRHRMIPPSANYSDCGDVIPLKGSAFYVPTAAEAWTPRAADGLRRAAVSAFGFGGINAHVLIEADGDSASRGARLGGSALLGAQTETHAASGGHGPPYGTHAASGGHGPPYGTAGVGARKDSRTSECGGHGPAYGIGSESLEPVAIVGMDARFGSAEGLDAFRDVVFAGASPFGRRSAARWRGAEEMLGDVLGGLDVGVYLDQFAQAAIAVARDDERDA